MPSDSPDRFRQSWQFQESAGKPAQAWLIVRRIVASLLAMSLIGLCVWLIVRTYFVPQSYIAYWSASAYQPLSAGPVKYACGDYAAIAALEGGFSGSNLVNPANEKLTKDALEKNLLALGDLRMKRKDVCIVFITAHGRVRGNEAYLLCEPGDQDSLKPVSEVLAELSKLRAGNKLLILDAGREELATDKGGNDDTFPDLLRAAVAKAADPSLWVLTANASFERSHVSAEKERSIFGYMVSQALGGEADGGKDGHKDDAIDLNEFCSYVQSAVTAWVEKATLGGETQTPQFYHFEKDVPNLPLVKAPKHAIAEEAVAQHGDEKESKAKPTGWRKLAADQGKKIVEESGYEETLHMLGLGHEGHEEHGEAGDAHDEHAEKAAGEHGGTANKDATHGKNAETKVNLASARADVQNAWKAVAVIESSPKLPSPGAVDPASWRELIDKLLWCDQFCESGVPTDSQAWKQFTKTLAGTDGVNQLLKAFAEYRLKAPVKGSAGQVVTFALANRMAANDTGSPLRKSAMTGFMDEYNRLLSEEPPPATFRDDLNKLLASAQKSNLGIENYYEFQLVAPGKESRLLELNNDSAVPAALLQQVLKARLNGEKVASDPLCGDDWLQADIQKADSERSEGERELLDRTSANWKELASKRLASATAAYESASKNLKTIRDALQYRNSVLLRAPDLVHRTILDGGPQKEVAAVRKIIGSIGKLNQALAKPAETNAEDLALIQKELEAELKEMAVQPGNAWRMANQLATALPEPDEREALSDGLRNAELRQMAKFEVPPPKTDPSTPSPVGKEQWARILEEFSAQIDLARLAGCEDEAAKALLPSSSVDGSKAIDKINEARNKLAKQLDNVPNAIERIVKESGTGGRVRPDQLRAALPHWLLLSSSRQARVDSKYDLLTNVDLASWHRLLEWNSTRFLRATDDAPVAIQPLLRKTADAYRRLANQIQVANAIPQFNSPGLSIESPPEVSLISSENETFHFKVTSNANEGTPTWLVAQYNNGSLDVESRAVHQHDLPEAANKLGEKAPGYPLRPKELGFGVTDTIPARGSVDYTVKLTRKSDTVSVGPAKLILKAISEKSFVRREMNVILPHKPLLEIIVNSPGGPETKSPLALRPLPNREQNFSFDVADTSGDNVEKNIDVSIWAPTSVPGEERLSEIPSGAIDKELADRMLEPYGLQQLGPDFPIKLPASGMPARVKLTADDSKEKPPANLLPKDKIDPKTWEGIQLNHGLLIRLTDKKTNQVTVRRIKITPLRPRGFLEAKAYCKRSGEFVEIKVKATNPTVIPTDGLKIVARVSGASDQGENSLVGTLKAPSNEVTLSTELLKTSAQDVTATVDVDKYPRAFVFKFARYPTTDDKPISPRADLHAVRIVSPDSDSAYRPVNGLTTVKVKAEVDAPDGKFDSDDDSSRLDVGIDLKKPARSLDPGDPIETRRSDRQVTVAAKSLSPDGVLALESEVGDFEIDVPTGTTNVKANVLGRLVIDGKSYLNDLGNQKEIILDGAPPVIQADFPPQPGILPTQDLREEPKVIKGEDLLIHVFMSDEAKRAELSGVSTVKGAFALEATDGSKPTKPEIGVTDGNHGWIIKLSTNDEKLGLGRNNIRITATDRVGNESEPLQKTVVIVEKPAKKAAPAPNNAANAKPVVQPNNISGVVQYGDEGVKAKVELIGTAGPPIKPTESNETGKFEFTKVPPGKYTVKAVTVEALQNYHLSAEKEIEVPAAPAKVAPVNLKVRWAGKATPAR